MSARKGVPGHHRGGFKQTAEERAARFWARVNKDGPTQPHMTTPCWVFGGRPKNGYGSQSQGGQSEYAHRISWEMHFGSPGSLLVCHHCDHRPCVRPDHLFLGTVKDNTADMRAKGRGSDPPRWEGQSHPAAKLTEVDVLEIRRLRALGVTLPLLAEHFGISQTQVCSIAMRQSWGRVE